MTLNGTTQRILTRPLSEQQWRQVDAAPPKFRLGALWRTMKFGHPWPRHRNGRP
jgi:hypothetical protein